MLRKKHIVLGVCGGIAAYKIPWLVRDLRKAGASVRIVMTESATEFVTPLTLATVSGNEVIVGTFPEEKKKSHAGGTWHIDVARWAEVMLIAPATANTIAKLAHGYADNAVTTLALALRAPLVIAPAMDADMWQHELTQQNLTKLRELGCTIIPPEWGELASGLLGEGRLPEFSVLIQTLEEILSRAKKDLSGKKILVTAGPTYEAIDPVRFVGNRSSGKMGYAIATAAVQRGADVLLISGPTNLPAPKGVKKIDVESAEAMYSAVMKHYSNKDAIIMAAAVADFTPAMIAPKKIKKETLRGNRLTLELRPTKDILKSVSEKAKSAVVVGFALETHNGLQNAKTKLKEKKLALIVLNNPLLDGAGFGQETNRVTIVSKNGKVEKLNKMSKFDVAHEILNRVARLL
jgi:phosphopantothenoylcysteine decarboxylase/phosphopantothenate--cysteine ligase